jgi:hypothetical protein
MLKYGNQSITDLKRPALPFRNCADLGDSYEIILY